LATAFDLGGGNVIVAGVLGASGGGKQAFPPAARAAVLDLAREILVRRERRRTEEMTRLNATADRVAAASLDLEKVLTEIVRDASELVGADGGDLFLLDQERQIFRVVALYNSPDELMGIEFGAGEGLSAHVIREGQAVVVDDYQQYPARLPAFVGFGHRAAVAAPLVSRDQPVGVLTVHTFDAARRFSQHSADLLTAFANHAAIAIDNARRYQNEARLAEDLSRANQELIRSLTLQRRIVEQVILDRGPTALAQELATILEEPVVLHDQHLRVIAGAAPSEGEEWKELAVPKEATGDPAVARFLSEVVASRRMATVPAPILTGPSRLVTPIPGASADVSGFLVLPWKEPLTSLDRALVEVAVTGVALELGRLMARVETEERLRGEVVMDLLTGSFASPETIAARAAQLGYDLSEPHDLVVFRLDDFEARTHSFDRSWVLSMQRKFHDTVLSSASIAAGSMVATDRDTVTLLLSRRPRGRRRRPVESQWVVDRTRDLLRATLPELSVSAVIGDRCERPSDYPASFSAAAGTLEAAYKLGRRDSVIRAADLGTSRLLVSATSKEQLVAFATRILGPLLRNGPYERELLGTLQTFVDSGFSKRETSRRSFLHVNTVSYRLRRVEKLLDVRLADAHSALDVTFALRIAVLAGLY
jgi:sugar diacid utilization regulator